MSSPQVVVRDPVDGRMYIYNSGTLSWEAWSGQVTLAGGITIGTVDQGTGGASAWLMTFGGVAQPVSGPLTDAQLRASAVVVSGAVVTV